MAESRRTWIRGISVGAILLFIVHALVWLAVKLLNFVFPGWYSLGLYILLLHRVWLWQFVYAIPAVIWAGGKGYRWAARGIVLGTLITIVVNVFFGLLFDWDIGIGRA